MRSDDEAVRLAAVWEGFDRLLGSAPLSVDSTSTKIEHNIQQLYLTAVQEANRLPDPRAPVDVTPAADAGDGAVEWCPPVGPCARCDGGVAPGLSASWR
jgi:hypothetical protein